jgi:hypothetical protein
MASPAVTLPPGELIYLVDNTVLNYNPTSPTETREVIIESVLWMRIRIRMDSHSFDGHWLRNAGSRIRIQIRIKTERKEPEEISA